MKASDFARVVRAIADRASGTEARALMGLADALSQTPAATVATALKGIGGTTGLSSVWDGRMDAATALTNMRPLIEAVGKTGALKDLDAAIDLLMRGATERTAKPKAPRGVKASAGKTSPKPGAVDDYTRELEGALGNQARFSDVFERLSADSGLGVSGIKAIAKAFAQATAKSKADALKKIWARHQSLLSFDAKARATDGRSAA